MWKIILIVLAFAAVAVGLMIAVLGMKVFTKKEKEYRRPCANADPATGRCANCTCDRKGIVGTDNAASTNDGQ